MVLLRKNFLHLILSLVVFRLRCGEAAFPACSSYAQASYSFLAPGPEDGGDPTELMVPRKRIGWGVEVHRKLPLAARDVNTNHLRSSSHYVLEVEHVIPSTKHSTKLCECVTLLPDSSRYQRIST